MGLSGLVTGPAIANFFFSMQGLVFFLSMLGGYVLFEKLKQHHVIKSDIHRSGKEVTDRLLG